MQRTIIAPLFAAFLAACATAPDAGEPAAPAAPAAGEPAAPAAPRPATATAPKPRFDREVRDDFFAGLRGDRDALDRAIALCEATLARHPEHAEALVWHGAALIIRSSERMRAGDRAAGMDLWRRGLAEMDRAVALAPDRVAVRIPRGATLLAMTPFLPAEVGEPLLQKGVGDYERALALQEPALSSLSLHARGQLLYGLADGWERLGRRDRAEHYYQRLRAEGAGSAYAERADAWLAGDPQPRQDASSCAACHAESPTARPRAIQ